MSITPGSSMRIACSAGPSAKSWRTISSPLRERISEQEIFTRRENAGLRALRNAALTLLTARGSSEDFARVEAHYRKASNMTDACHALFLVAGVDAPGRVEILEDFFERWKDDHLVIDIWFAAQAQSPRPTVLDEVKALCLRSSLQDHDLEQGARAHRYVCVGQSAAIQSRGRRGL